MRSIDISEEDLKNLDLIAELLLYDENDPRSSRYQRKLVRPTIHWWRIALVWVAVLGSAFGVWFAVSRLTASGVIAWLSCIAYVLLVLLFRLKQSAICVIQIYQRYASSEIRNKCRFEPSCSEYMILSLQKYGFWKGVRKGINRLSRCNVNDGGYDAP